MNNFYDIFSVKGKKVLITGAANGNGEAIARAFGSAGSKLCLVDIDEEKLICVAKSIESSSNYAVDKFVVDLGNIDSLDRFIALNNDFDFDIVINNAGITIGNTLHEYKDTDWNATHNINLFAPYKIMQSVAKKMAKKKSGSIINITSLAAELGFPGNPAYVASKGGLKQLTKAVASELSPLGVRVNSVAPGYIKTNMTNKSFNDRALRQERSDRTMMGHWGESNDLIGIMIFLASDASKYVTGQDFYIDGGWVAKGL
jgi:NAD(P)-dependent dehydrogenase (short-subunit alcohol dehydrogenase family)